MKWENVGKLIISLTFFAIGISAIFTAFFPNEVIELLNSGLPLLIIRCLTFIGGTVLIALCIHLGLEKD